MPNFRYKAINQEGKMVESVLLAPNQKSVIAQLQKLSMTPVSIALEKEKSAIKNTSSVKLDVKTVVMFTKQLQTLLKAGIPIVTCLNVIKEQSESENFEQVITAIAKDIEGGSKLSDALAEFPKAFPELYINSIKVGEISGTLEDTLIQLANFLEEDERIKKAVKKALRYPVMVIVALIVAFFLFVTMIIPNFLPIFEMSGAELPLPTKILMGIYYALTDYGIFVLLLLGILAGVGVMWYRSPQGPFQLDSLKLKIPVMGELIRKVNISRFAKLFYTMNSTGIPITKTFTIIHQTLDNLVFRKEVEKIQGLLVKGSDIASALKQSPYFTKLLVIMISIGEQSGSLDEMLGNVSEYYYQEVNDTVDNLTSMIEPIVTVVLGGMMLFLALAVFLPMWDMIGTM